MDSKGCCNKNIVMPMWELRAAMACWQLCWQFEQLSWVPVNTPSTIEQLSCCWGHDLVQQRAQFASLLLC